MVGIPHTLPTICCFTFGFTAVQLCSHIALFGTCCLLLPRPPLGQQLPTLPDALKDTVASSEISITKIQSVRMLARALRLNYQRFLLPLALSLRSPSGLFMLLLLPVFQHRRALGNWRILAHQYMNPDGISLGLRKRTLGLCLLGWDL